MGIANCGGRVRDLGMFLLSFGLLNTQRERERERERERGEPNVVGRGRRCQKEGEGILDSTEIVFYMGLPPFNEISKILNQTKKI